MRPIGTLPDAKAVAVFGDLLTSRRLANQMDRESDGTFTVWIKDDDQIQEATLLLREFLASPNSEKFRTAAADAAAVKRAEAEDLEAFRRRVRTADGLFTKTGGYGIGWLSYALIAISVGVAILTSLGSKREVVQYLLIDDPSSLGFLVKVRAGEVWRLITPIFLHFGPLHLLFNMSWVYSLGCMIEARSGFRTLGSLVLITGLGSNFAQYLMSGPTFGGMSGVVYALIGYCWMRGKYDRTSGIFLDQRNLIISIVWMVACFTNLLGPIANTAHVSGLVCGLALGRFDAWRSGRVQR